MRGQPLLAFSKPAQGGTHNRATVAESTRAEAPGDERVQPWRHGDAACSWSAHASDPSTGYNGCHICHGHTRDDARLGIARAAPEPGDDARLGIARPAPEPGGPACRQLSPDGAAPICGPSASWDRLGRSQPHPIEIIAGLRKPGKKPGKNLGKKWRQKMRAKKCGQRIGVGFRSMREPTLNADQSLRVSGSRPVHSRRSIEVLSAPGPPISAGSIAILVRQASTTATMSAGAPRGVVPLSRVRARSSSRGHRSSAAAPGSRRRAPAPPCRGRRC